MKKLSIALVLVALFCVILTAVSCGESATTTPKATETSTPATTTPSATTPSATTPAKVTTTKPVVTTTVPVTTTPVSTTPESTGKKDPVVAPAPSVLNIQNAFSRETFVASNGLTLPYRFYLPKDYSEEYAYPVLLFFHGAGERGNDNTYQLKHVLQDMFRDKNNPFFQSIIVVPQCPSDMQWVDTPWANGNYNLSRVPISKPMTAAVELLDSIINTYSVNPDRQYVMGLSMGGFGTWDLLMRYPERFAGAIPICGSADMTKGETLVNIPIWTFHDTTDDAVPVSGTQLIVKAIQNAGGKLIKYTETSQYGHLVWAPAAATEGLFDWLYSQRKDQTE